jgi:hypothetical protein
MRRFTILYELITLMLNAACEGDYRDEEEFEEHEESHER